MAILREHTELEQCENQKEKMFLQMQKQLEAKINWLGRLMDDIENQLSPYCLEQVEEKVQERRPADYKYVPKGLADLEIQINTLELLNERLQALILNIEI